MRSRTRLPVVAALAAAALLGTACTNEDTSPPPEHDQGGSAEVSPADVSFAQDMVPHHEQAVEMADLVPERTDDPAVSDLAERIRQAQQPEIDQLGGWLDEWDTAEAPPQRGDPAESGNGQHGGHDSGEAQGDHGSNGGHDMDGMMSEADMAQLEQAAGPAFDRMWLEMMIEHHRGAVDMAQSELADGSHPGAQKMAQEIIDSQRAEIDEMRGMLDEG